jgi:MFS family permease
LSTAGLTPSGLPRVRIAILIHFIVLGASTATWSARLPAIKDELQLSDFRLSLALFAVPAGSVLTLALSGRITDRFGAVRVLRVAGLLVPTALVLIGLPRNLPLLMVVLAGYGAVAGLLDVSMNACGARLEVAYGRPILSSLHAGYSIAGLAGAGIGGIFAWLDLGPLPTFVTAAALVGAAAVVAGRQVALPPVVPHADQPDAAPLLSARRISLVIAILGLLALCGQLGEGAAGDWSAVYLHGNLHSSAGAATIGLAAFSITMAAGRMVGDRLAIRFGPVALVRVSGLVAGLGLLLSVLVPVPAVAIAGFALLGAGLASIFPQIVSAAARLDPERAGSNIGRIASVAYLGLLGGPVAIGALAAGVGLRNALLLPAALAIVVTIFANVMRPPAPRPPAPRPPAPPPARSIARLTSLERADRADNPPG